MHDLHVQHIDRHDRRDDRRGDDGRRCTTREILRSATRAGPRGALGQRAQDDSAARRRGQGDRRGFLGSGVWQRVGAVAIDLRSGGAPLRGAQLRSVGPARQQSSLRSARPAGANYYPPGMTKSEFEAEVAKGGVRADSLKSLYTMVRRDAAGHLTAIPFSTFFATQHERAARRLEEAAALADDPGLKNYLTL